MPLWFDEIIYLHEVFCGAVSVCVCVCRPLCVLMTLLINEFPSIFIRLFALPEKAPVSRMYASHVHDSFSSIVEVYVVAGAVADGRSNNTSSN